MVVENAARQPCGHVLVVIPGPIAQIPDRVLRSGRRALRLIGKTSDPRLVRLRTDERLRGLGPTPRPAARAGGIDTAQPPRRFRASQARPSRASRPPAAQLLEATGIVKSLVITAGWFGATWKPDEVSAVLTTLITLIAFGWA